MFSWTYACCILVLKSSQNYACVGLGHFSESKQIMPVWDQIPNEYEKSSQNHDCVGLE